MRKLYKVKFTKLSQTEFPANCVFTVIADNVVRAAKAVEETTTSEVEVIITSVEEVNGTVLIDKEQT